MNDGQSLGKTLSRFYFLCLVSTVFLIISLDKNSTERGSKSPAVYAPRWYDLAVQMDSIQFYGMEIRLLGAIWGQLYVPFMSPEYL